MRLAHLPVTGTYLISKNVGRSFVGHVSSDKHDRLLAFPPSENKVEGAQVCRDGDELKGLLLKGGGSRVDVGNGKPASVLKAEPRW